MKLRARADGREIELRPSLVLGRADDCGAVVADDSVSRHHARFELRDDRWWLVDLGSSNGTRINGVKLKEGPVGPGDLVTLGSVAFDVLGGALEAPAEPPPASAPAPRGSAAVETERARLRAEARSLQRARGFGDLAQQSLAVRLFAAALALALMIGIALGVRWLGHVLAGR